MPELIIRAASKKQIDYAKKIERLIEQTNNLTDGAARRAVRLVQSAHKEVTEKILARGTDFSKFIVPELERAAAGVLGEFSEKYGSAVAGMLEESALVRAEGYVAAVSDFGIEIGSLPEINTTLIEVAQNYTTDLIEGASKEGARKINQAIRSGAAGGKTPAEVVDEIGKSLKQKGPFRSLQARAQLIGENELSRVAQVAGDARVRQMARVAEIIKEWLASFVQRTNHIAINGQQRPADGFFDVPLLTGGTEKMRYPNYPGASAENTIRCKCNSVPRPRGMGDVLKDRVSNEKACLVHGTPFARAA